MNNHNRLNRLFLHYFDTHFIEDKGTAADQPNFFEEMRLATRLAVASADCVYVPAASYFESNLCRRVIDSLGDLVSLGFISLAGSSLNLDEYLRERQDEDFYRKGSVQHSWYRTRHDAAMQIPYARRNRSATRDVTAHWKQSVLDDSLARKIRDAAGTPVSKIESRLERVPEEIGSLAFIPEHVFEILDAKALSPLIRSRIRSVINEGYFESYTRDLETGVVIDLRYLSSDFKIPAYGPNLSYSRMIRFLHASNRIREFSECSNTRLLQFGNEPEWQAALAKSMTYIGAEMQQQPKIQAPLPEEKPSATGLSTTQEKIMNTILCIAAAQVEFETARSFLEKTFGNGKPAPVGDGDYALKFVDQDTNAHWYLAGQSFQGQVDSALTAKNLSSLTPSITLMVGMCMGMPDRKFSIGTVIVPNEVIAFDHQRLTTEGTTHRPHSDRVDNSLYRLARIVASQKRIYKVISDKGIASASIKIEEPTADLVKRIQSSFPDVVAFDMESSGFYRAAGNKCLWIKAVADNGEPQNTDDGARSEKQRIQSDATENAMDFAVALVREYITAHSQQ